MDNIINIIAGVIALYFIAAMLMFFYWLYFHKGSLKKALIHIVVSLGLLCLLVGVKCSAGKASMPKMQQNRQQKCQKLLPFSLTF